jgi:hypothetical protein
MTATVELSERLVRKAEKLTGICDESKMLNEVLKTYINAEEFARAMVPLQGSKIWDGDDKRKQQ